MIKGVIFDLDGVLVSTDTLHYEAWKRLADEIGIVDFTKKDNERQRGVSRMESLEIVLAKGRHNYTAEEKMKLADRKNRYYQELLCQMDEKNILSGARETLMKLRERKKLTAVGSASKNALLILEKTGLGRYFDAVASGLDITHSKPHPEVFQVAARKLGLPCEECLVVEDAAAGIQAAKSAGMRTIGVGVLYRQLGADASAESLADFSVFEQFLG